MAKELQSLWSKNYHEATIFYIMHSNAAKLFKFGITKDFNDRLRQIKVHGPAETSDWRYVCCVLCGENHAGLFETNTARFFSQYNQIRGQLTRKNSCKELYDVEASVIQKYLKNKCNYTYAGMKSDLDISLFS